MNLRILKKLSKRAAPLLPLLGDDREQFPAEKGQNYQGIAGHDRKHWHRTMSVHPDVRHGEIKYRPKHGQHWVAMREPYHPLKHTPMIGSTIGYYEPEWSESSAWEALVQCVAESFTTWNVGDGAILHRKLDTPTLVFKAAQELIDARRLASDA